MTVPTSKGTNSLAETAILPTFLVTKDTEATILATLLMNTVANFLDEIPLGWVDATDPVDRKTAAPVANNLGTIDKPNSLETSAVTVT